MEFMVDHPLCLLQGLTALVAFAAGLLSYHFGWRRAARHDRSGRGGASGSVISARPGAGGPGTSARYARLLSGRDRGPGRSGTRWNAAGAEGLLLA